MKMCEHIDSTLLEKGCCVFYVFAIPNKVFGLQNKFDPRLCTAMIRYNIVKTFLTQKISAVAFFPQSNHPTQYGRSFFPLPPLTITLISSITLCKKCAVRNPLIRFKIDNKKSQFKLRTFCWIVFVYTKKRIIEQEERRYYWNAKFRFISVAQK